MYFGVLESSPNAFRSLAISLANAFSSSRVYWYGSRSAESLEATGTKDNSLSGIRHFENERTTSLQKEKNKMRTKRTLAFRLLLCVGLLMCPTVVALGQGGKTDE